MRGRLLFSLCVLSTILLISTGAMVLAQGGGPGEAPPAGTELDSLKRDILVAAHDSAFAEKKEKPEPQAERQALSRPGGLLVGLEGNAASQPLRDLLTGFAGVIEGFVPQLKMAVVALPDAANVDALLGALRGLDGVKWAEPDYLRSLRVVPNDYFEPQEWYLDPINAYEAWDVTTGSSAVTMAVVDSGIRPTHEDLSGGRLLAGYNTYTGGAVTQDYDQHGHGTFVAGVAAAKTNNSVGVAGIDWSCKIMPVCVDNGTGISTSKSVQGILYAADHGADIINLSYGGYDFSQAEREAVDYAREKGCVVVSSRGNNGIDDPLYPACLPNVIGVGSSADTGQKSGFSDYGFGLDVLAPGESIVGPGRGSDSEYWYGGGTSFSAPLVSGQAGLILAENPDSSPREVEWRIEESAQGSGTWSENAGFGVIDMSGAIGLSGDAYRDTMEPNDTEGQARDLDTGGYDSYVSCNSDIDIYRIRPQRSGYAYFALADIPAGCDYDLLLYEDRVNDDPDSGTLVAYSMAGGNSPEFIQYPVAAGRSYYLAVDSYGGYSTQDPYTLLVLNPYISNNWFFSEGHTGTGFDEWLCVQNPGDGVANVEVQYMFEQGQETRTYGVDPHSRYTINVNEEVGAGRNVSAQLYSEVPVVAERPMYFDYKAKWQGGHDVMGATSPFYYWFFAEGYTGTGFEEWLCLQNPNEGAIEATVTYMYQGGGTDVKTYALNPLSRYTINVNEAVGEGRNVSIMVESEDALVAERPMYFNYKGKWRGGHDVIGVNVPSYAWFFAEGCTRAGFEEWLCLQNPNPDRAEVEVYFLTSGGDVYGQTVYVNAYSRETVNVNESLGEGYDVSLAVFSDIPIVAERPMYFSYRNAWDGGHNSQGCTLPSYSWFFAEGCTRPGMETWLCLQNPGDEDAAVTVNYMLGTGQTINRVYNVGALSRYTINVVDDVGAWQDVAIGVESNQTIVAERPMYFSYQGSRIGGHDAMGYVPGD